MFLMRKKSPASTILKSINSDQKKTKAHKAHMKQFKEQNEILLRKFLCKYKRVLYYKLNKPKCTSEKKQGSILEPNRKLKLEKKQTRSKHLL